MFGCVGVNCVFNECSSCAYCIGVLHGCCLGLIGCVSFVSYIVIRLECLVSCVVDGISSLATVGLGCAER